MPLQYIELFYHKDDNLHSVFLRYIIDDMNISQTKAEKIIEVGSQRNLMYELANLIQTNIGMIKDLKFSIGSYNNFDMVIDFTKFLKDIEKILRNIDFDETDRVQQYLSIYQSLLDVIVELETQAISHELRSLYIDILLTSFKYYAYSLYISKEKVDFKCAVPNCRYSSPLQVQFYNGIPISICRSHEFVPEINDFIKLLSFD